jgi:hypothetical protein
MMLHFVIKLILAATTVGLGVLHAQELRVSSSDFDIQPGYKVIVNGKVTGTAPLFIALKLNARHKIATEVSDVRVREFFLTVRDVDKSKEVESIPAWFVNPTLHQSDFSGYTSLTPATSIAASIEAGVKEAQDVVRSKMSRGKVNRYWTIREDQVKLDSSSSNYYVNLTRGQMDSLNDVNGGKMVLQSSPALSTVTFLEYEIQKIGEEYRVYVLAGRK